MTDILTELNSIGAETADALERFMNDEKKYLKYVQSFPEEATMLTLKVAMANKDYASAKTSAHALKGIVSNLGFTSLTDTVVDLYAELLEDNLDEAVVEYAHVLKQYERYCTVILNWRKEA